MKDFGAIWGVFNCYPLGSLENSLTPIEKTKDFDTIPWFPSNTYSLSTIVTICCDCKPN